MATWDCETKCHVTMDEVGLCIWRKSPLFYHNQKHNLCNHYYLWLPKFRVFVHCVCVWHKMKENLRKSQTFLYCKNVKLANHWAGQGPKVIRFRHLGQLLQHWFALYSVRFFVKHLQIGGSLPDLRIPTPLFLKTAPLLHCIALLRFDNK